MKDTTDVDRLLGTIRATLYTQQQDQARKAGKRTPLPFITISRQAGAGGRSLAQRLVERLNELEPDDRPWSAWERNWSRRSARSTVSLSLWWLRWKGRRPVGLSNFS